MSVGADYLVLWRKLAGDFVVQDAHRNGFQVFVWTVDGPAEIRRMIDLGVDGIISNYPERVFRELE
jgi:glycerophosphoryl diester phosphodiesterase